MSVLGKIVNLAKTEPALLTNAAQAILGVVIAFGLHLTTDQTGVILAAVGAVVLAITAAATRPLTPSAFTGLVVVAGNLLAAFGFHLNADLVSSVNLAIVAVFALLGVRAQVTPVVKLRAAANPARPRAGTVA